MTTNNAATIKTTPLENAVILAIGNSEYGDGPGSWVWTFSAVSTRGEKAALGSLYRKGLAQGQPAMHGENASCCLTEAGVKLFHQIQRIDWELEFKPGVAVRYYVGNGIKQFGRVAGYIAYPVETGQEPMVAIEYMDAGRKMTTHVHPRDCRVEPGMVIAIEDEPANLIAQSAPTFLVKRSAEFQRTMF